MCLPLVSQSFGNFALSQKLELQAIYKETDDFTMFAGEFMGFKVTQGHVTLQNNTGKQ